MLAIIIDDEEPARSMLRELLREMCPNVEIVAEAGSVSEGVKAIRAHSPDVVFLDIEMPGGTGFTLLEFFPKPNFEIIFATAYQHFAMQAFEVSAFAYLLKPIQASQLLRAIDKLEMRQTPPQYEERMEALKINLQNNGQITRIAIPVVKGLMFVDVNDIVYLEASSAYTELYCANGDKLVVSKNIRELEKMLSFSFFFRPHRSFIVNLNRVKELVKRDGGYIVMDNGGTVMLAKEKMNDFVNAYKG